MEYLFILRFKGPLRFSMFGTRLSFKQFWLCLFLNGLRDFGCRAPFWKPCAFACLPARLYSICFRPSVAARYFSRWKGLHVSTSGWTVFAFFFPGKAHAANSRSASSSLVNGLVLMRQPPAKVKRSWNCLRFLLRFAFGLGKLNKTNNPSISFM